MRQITLINACFFLYVLLSAKPLAGHDGVRRFPTINGPRLDQIFDCNKNKSCSKTPNQSSVKIKHAAIPLAALGTDLSFWAYTASNLRSFQLQIFHLPIYRHLKTGLSPPLFS
ncbi:MAG: hypothetical protein ACXVCE_09390 [Bacteriovorax sp.]